MNHKSDCAVHNMPAYDPGDCDCGATISGGPFDIAKWIRTAMEKTEAYSRDQTLHTRRQAELRLTWHHLIDAYSLITKGRLTPDSLEWGSEEAAKILKPKHTQPSG